jgi:hypothetical protein
MRPLPASVSTVFLLCSAPAFAQDVRPPVEVGVGMTAVARVPDEDFGLPANTPGAVVRATVPFTTRYSIEGLMTVSRRKQPFFRTVEGFYLIQINQRILSGTRGGFHPFVTYGAAGYFRHVRASPYKVPSAGGRFRTYGGFSYLEVDQPIAALFGAGVQHVLNRRLAVRAEAQLVTVLWIPLAGRFDASASIPIGRGYASH